MLKKKHAWSNDLLIFWDILSPLCGVFSNFEWKKKSSVSSSSHVVCKMERQVVNKGRQRQLNLWGGNFYIHGFNISYQWKVWLCIVVVRHLGLHKKLEKLFTTKLEYLNGLSNISICNWDAQISAFAKKVVRFALPCLCVTITCNPKFLSRFVYFTQPWNFRNYGPINFFYLV